MTDNEIQDLMRRAHENEVEQERQQLASRTATTGDPCLERLLGEVRRMPGPGPHGGWWVTRVALAATLLVGIGIGTLTTLFLARPAVDLAGVAARSVYDLVDPNVFAIENGTLKVAVRYDPSRVRPRVRSSEEPGREYPLTQESPPDAAGYVAAVWRSPKLTSEHGYKGLTAALEMVPVDDAARPVTVHQREFVIGPGGIERGINDLARLINELQLLRVVELRDPQAFRLESGDRLAVELTVHPAFVQEVLVRWGGEPEGVYTTVYKSGTRAFVPGELHTVKEISPPLRGEQNTLLTASVKIVPYPEAKAKLPLFFTPERTEFSRTFRLTPYGLTLGGQLPPPSVERISYARDPALRNLYLVSGVAYPQPKDAPPTGYLIIEPKLGGQAFVGARIGLSPDGVFVARCYLGARGVINREYHNIYVVVARSKDVRVFEDNEQIAPDFDWEGAGFVRSAAKLKLSDGEDGFTRIP